MENSSPHTYNIKLPYFEGPFDLLLFFIERDELDIYDIPIATITNDFLNYIRQMDRLDIDLASEFILVAASLMRIKAKMLLPRKPVDEEGNEIDPREELVRRLLEYKQYKGILDELRDFESERSLKSNRGNSAREMKEIAARVLVDAELESLTTYKLMKAFKNVLDRFEDREKILNPTIIRFHYTVTEEQTRIIQLIKKAGRVNFATIFEECKNRIHAIFNFLALLELVHLQKLAITQGEGINNFWVSE